MRLFPCASTIACLLAALPLNAAQYSGTVRAADEFVPGATVIAVQGDTRVSAYTDEDGRFTMDLAPGDWDVQVQMFEFTTAHDRITVGPLPLVKSWTLEMPKVGEREGAQAKTPAPAAATRQRNRQGRGGGQGFGRAGGRGGFGPGGGRGGPGGPNVAGRGRRTRTAGFPERHGAGHIRRPAGGGSRQP